MAALAFRKAKSMPWIRLVGGGSLASAQGGQAMWMRGRTKWCSMSSALFESSMPIISPEMIMPRGLAKTALLSAAAGERAPSSGSAYEHCHVPESSGISASGY
jgi:hypothetical protein